MKKFNLVFWSFIILVMIMSASFVMKLYISFTISTILAIYLFYKLSKTKDEGLKIGTTERGFALGEFTDRYGSKCSIQKSSLATEDCIWLGVDDARPKILASQAHKFGVKTNETTGWVDYPIPDEVNLSTRMHLTRDMVSDLLPTLQKFVETGEI